jgi:hypothetical protein
MRRSSAATGDGLVVRAECFALCLVGGVAVGAVPANAFPECRVEGGPAPGPQGSGNR